MLAIMDLIVSNNRTAVSPDLDSRQGISIDIVSFYEASAITKNINSTLVTIKNGITPVIGQNNIYIANVSSKYSSNEIIGLIHLSLEI